MRAEGEGERKQPDSFELSLHAAVFLGLHVLADGERSDYEITQELMRRIGGKDSHSSFWLSEQARGRMSICDLIEVTRTGRDPRFGPGWRGYYRLTDLGRRLLAAEAERANALTEKSTLPQVQEKLQPALELDPKYADSDHDMDVTACNIHVDFSKENELARLWMYIGRYDEAESLLRRAIETNPENPRALLNLGITLNYLRRYTDSVDPLMKVVTLRPFWPSAHIFLGIAMLETGQAAEALAHLERGTRARGLVQALAYLYLGKLHAQQGEPEKAAVAWESYLEKDPDSPNACRVRAWLTEFGRAPQL